MNTQNLWTRIFMEKLCDKNGPGYRKTGLWQISRPSWSFQSPCLLQEPVEKTFIESVKMNGVVYQVKFIANRLVQLEKVEEFMFDVNVDQLKQQKYRLRFPPGRMRCSNHLSLALMERRVTCQWRSIFTHWIKQHGLGKQRKRKEKTIPRMADIMNKVSILTGKFNSIQRLKIGYHWIQFPWATQL